MFRRRVQNIDAVDSNNKMTTIGVVHSTDNYISLGLSGIIFDAEMSSNYNAFKKSISYEVSKLVGSLIRG